MSEQLLPCPFCGGEAEIIENNTLLERSYSIRCKNHCAVTCGHYRRTVGIWRDTPLNEAVKTWNHRAEQERAENKPLTLEELRQMNGEPVYIQYGDGNCGWAIATYDNYSDSFYLCSPDFPDENPDTDFYNMEYNDPDGHYGLHVLGWRAYRSKPKEDA